MTAKPSLPVLHFAFLLTGVATVMMGILLPTVLARWSITDAQAGSLFIAQFTSSFVGSLLYGEIVERLGPTRTVVAGMSLIAAGICGIALTSWPMPLLFVALCGFSLGSTLPAINLAVAGACPERRSAALNLLNFSWTLGAVAAPLLFGYLLQQLRLSFAAVLLGLAGLFVASGISVFLIRQSPSAVEIQTRVDVTGATGSSWWIWLLTGMMLFLYVGAENAVPSWAPVMGMRSQILSAISLPSVQAFFWGALLAGRLAGGFLWKNTRPRDLISVSLLAATSGVVLLATSRSGIVLCVGMVLTGAGLAAVFPTSVAEFAQEATTSGKRPAGIVFAAAGLGGAGLPALIGWMSSHGYSLRLGMWLIALVIAFMFLLEQRIAIGRKKQSAFRAGVAKRAVAATVFDGDV